MIKSARWIGVLPLLTIGTVLSAPVAYDIDDRGCSTIMNQRLTEARSAAMEVNEHMVDVLISRPDSVLRTACSSAIGSAVDLLTQINAIPTFSVTDTITTALMNTARGIVAGVVGGVCGGLEQMVQNSLKPVGRLSNVNNLGNLAYGLFVADVYTQVNKVLDRMNLEGQSAFYDAYQNKMFGQVPVAQEYPSDNFLQRALQKVQSWWSK